MLFKITAIKFDLDCDYEEFTEQDRAELYEETVGSVWEAIDGDELVEQITGWCGWCIESIDYESVHDNDPKESHPSLSAAERNPFLQHIEF